MVKIKCKLCNHEKNKYEFDSNRIYEGMFESGEWGYCKNCVVRNNHPCSCCGSLQHNDNMAAVCDDWFHKVADGLVEDWLLGNKEKNDKQTGEELAGVYVRECEHFKKYLTPILGENCKCCGWHCVKKGDDECDYKYCGGRENADGKCHQFRKTCERFWGDKEKMRKWGSIDRHLSFHNEVNKENFYDKSINKPKQGFSCPHFQEQSRSEAEVINELQARIIELETQLANANLQAQQEQQPKQ